MAADWRWLLNQRTEGEGAVHPHERDLKGGSILCTTPHFLSFDFTVLCVRGQQKIAPLVSGCLYTLYNGQVYSGLGLVTRTQWQGS